MMKKIILLLLVLLISACAKKGVTPAKVKLNVAAMMNMSNTVGDGGAILFGKEKKGESFAMVVSDSTLTIDLSNGDWTFYALMWDKPLSTATGSTQATSVGNLNGTIYCALPVTKTLSGTDASVGLELKNANCSATAYSNAGLYTDPNTGKIRFSDVFLEECDELRATTTHTCGAGNRGSALSYKVVFSSYKKSSAGIMTYDATTISSACIKADRSTGILSNALPINIPNGSSDVSLPVSIKMYTGSDTCDDSDAKASTSVVLDQGVGAKSQSGLMVASNPNNCAIDSTAITGATISETREKCEDLMGQMSAINYNSCNTATIPNSIVFFAPNTLCTTPTITNAIATGSNTTYTQTNATGTISVVSGATLTAVYPSVKHLVAIPKASLCSKYIGQTSSIGTNPFSGGNGTQDRPYKICTEWQLNQIGENDSPAVYATAHYKLMNDLDMNLVDIGGKNSSTALYTKPTCVGTKPTNTSVGYLDEYHNLNPLDKIVDTSCGASSVIGFNGVFDGNGKTISNGRIFGRDISNVGFVRGLTSGGLIKNLNFNFLMVQGLSNVGAVAGYTSGPEAVIKNIKIDRSNIAGDSHNSTGTNAPTNNMVGGVAGKMSSYTFMENVQVTNTSVTGGDYVAGLTGQLSGKISKSSFSGNVKQGPIHGGNTGGLAASILTSGVIEQSFSEGFLEADSRHIGGISGYVEGFVNRAYSNMRMKLNNNFYYPGQVDYYVGGLFGYFSGASVTDVYFGGSLNIQNYPRSSTVYNAGIGGFGNGSSPSVSSCVTSETATPSYGCTQVPASYLRYGLMMNPGSNVPIFTQASFIQRAGFLPRLSWESGPCMDPVSLKSVVDQESAGRGSVSNPIVICTPSQLSSINNRPSSEHYLLGENISLQSWTQADLVSILKGKLHGNGKTLSDLNVTLSSTFTGDVSLFGTIETTGQIDNLNLVDMNIDGVNASLSYSGVLSSNNKGLLVNINIIGATLDSSAPTSGLLTGINFGSILQTKIAGSKLKVRAVGGAVAGVSSSTGVINKADIDSSVILNTPSGPTPILGGVVGKNEGSLDQVRYRGEVNSLYATTSIQGAKQGGIAGHNSGVISNAIVENSSRIGFNLFNYVGGVVGHNLGVVRNTINLGKVISGDKSTLLSTTTTQFDPLIGLDGGATGATTTNFFLEHNTATFLGIPVYSDVGTATVNTSTGSAVCETPIAVTQANTTNYSYISTAQGAKANAFLVEDGSDDGRLFNLIPISGLFTTANSSIVKYAPYLRYNNSSQCIMAQSKVQFYKEKASTSTGSKSASDFSNLSTFTSAGFSIAGKDASGTKIKQVELIEFFKSVMYGQPAPTNAPIWELEGGDNRPSLVQLNPFN